MPSADETRLPQPFDAWRADPGAAFRQASFEPFGLDGQWTGPRSLGGWGGSNDLLCSLTLTHGDPYELEEPLVRVRTCIAREVHADPAEGLRAERWRLARDLIGYLWRSTGTVDADARSAAFIPGDATGDPTARWDRITMPVDGSPTEVHVLVVEPAWVGVVDAGQRIGAIEALRWPADRTGLRSASSGDIDIYERGSGELRQRRFPTT